MLVPIHTRHDMTTTARLKFFDADGVPATLCSSLTGHPASSWRRILPVVTGSTDRPCPMAPTPD
jgi:hypothetical protein